ncbi:hypothetical protein AMTRI_Chr01g133180 [Amborella trichopoda]
MARTHGSKALRLVFRLSALLFFHFCWVVVAQNQNPAENDDAGTSIGVILDLDSRVGREMKIAMEIAIEDLQSSNHSLRRLHLQVRNSQGDPLQAASSAIDLINKHGVKAIVGLNSVQETTFVARVAKVAQVPIISFSSPPLCPTTTTLVSSTFLCNVASNNSLQMEGVAAIVASYQWSRVNLIHDDDDSSSGAFPFLIKALSAVGSKIEQRLVFSAWTSTYDVGSVVRQKLQRLKENHCKVFVVHITSMALGNIMFEEAKRMGMMENEYVWIITDPLTSLLDCMNSSAFASMRGVLGIKTSYISKTIEVKEFSSRFSRRFEFEYPNGERAEPSIYGLRAYDTINLLNHSIETIKTQRSKNCTLSRNETITPFNLRPSVEGLQLLEVVLSSDLIGLSGKMRFQNRELPASAVQIINVIGKHYKTMGFWSPEDAFWKYKMDEGITKNISMDVLGPVIFPGGPNTINPRGWQSPKNMRIGVPLRKGFKQFVESTSNGTHNETQFRGFIIDVFEAVLKRLPYDLPYKFFPYYGNYSDLVDQVYRKEIDAIVGDITILANRSRYVDFTHPVLESGVQLLVPVKNEISQKAWLFMRPFTEAMWLVTGALFIYTGVVVWGLERHINPEFGGTLWNQIGTLLCFIFSTLFFAHRESLRNNFSRAVMTIWLFVVLILTSSYTASLTSMLTVQRLEPTVTSINNLLRNKATVGCIDASFMFDYVNQVLGFERSNIKRMKGEEDFAQALSNGTIAAAIMEIPFIKLFLSQKKCKGITVAGPTYRLGGDGFVFPLGSPLTSDFSKAILEIKESGNMAILEERWFSSIQCPTISSDGNNGDSLSLDSFWGLFLITGGTSTLVLIIFLSIIVHNYRNHVNEEEIMEETKSSWRYMVAFAKYWDELQIENMGT